MTKKEKRKRIFDEVRADRVRYDDLTRRLKERIARDRSQAQAERRDRS